MTKLSNRSLVPFLGAVLNIIVTLLGLGAVAITLWDYWRRQRQEPQLQAAAMPGGGE